MNITKDNVTTDIKTVKVNGTEVKQVKKDGTIV